MKDDEMGGACGTYRQIRMHIEFWWGNLKMPLERSRHREKDNIKMGQTEVGSNGVDWIHLKWSNLRSSGILRSVVWYLFSDVSGQRIDPLFKGQEVQQHGKKWLVVVSTVMKVRVP
jgi:hypothetical protein